MPEIDDRLLKVIELARQGIGGEKDAAITIVRKRCAELGLNFDEVMDATDEREFMLEVPIKNSAELTVVSQVCLRFALTEKHPTLMVNNKAKVFFYTTTPGKHIETVNAALIYLKAFRKERRKIMDDLVIAFVHKHNLFRQFEKDDISSPSREIDLAQELRALQIARNMDDVVIHKQIGEVNERT